MKISQNGWPASADKNAIGIVDFIIHGVSFPGGVKKGDVFTVLGYVVEQFHEHVQPLHNGWCWGYDNKNIEGSTEVSNHASGTAVDINAPQHPMGGAESFSTIQRATIHKILAFCEGYVRWGGDYSGRRDEMHFEINTNPSNLAKLAAKIKGIPVVNPPVVKPPTSTVLQKGSTGQKVKDLQVFFNEVFPLYRESVSVKRGYLLTVDGIFGDQTDSWVKEFQHRTSLTVDGIVGPITVAKLRSYGYNG